MEEENKVASAALGFIVTGKKWEAPDYTSTTFEFTNPKQTWKWSVFGDDGLMVVWFTDRVKQPPWRQRFLTRLLLGSKWTWLGE